MGIDSGDTLLLGDTHLAQKPFAPATNNNFNVTMHGIGRLTAAGDKETSHDRFLSLDRTSDLRIIVFLSRKRRRRLRSRGSHNTRAFIRLANLASSYFHTNGEFPLRLKVHFAGLPSALSSISFIYKHEIQMKCLDCRGMCKSPAQPTTLSCLSRLM